MRACYICNKIDVLNSMEPLLPDQSNDNYEIIQNLLYFANISVVSMKENPALICKLCERMTKTCADFKKKCIEADQKRKSESNERFLWVENLTELRTNPPIAPPIEEEIIETVGTIEEPPPIIENLESTIKIAEEDRSYDIIDKLSYDQLKEMTDEVAKLLTNNFFENEQFQCIKGEVAKKSTTTLPPSSSTTRYINCSKCKAKFPDISKLAFHRHAAHKIRRKNIGTAKKKKKNR